ncbi:uncharacterized protein TNCV_1055511 [Trichonephila clavipes]|nr:uncharacterized protein TNCV_1055511 [Trichonephila clavipes]
MADSSSFIPTHLAYADNQGEGRPTKFNSYNPEVRDTNGFNVLPKVYFSVSENVKEFLEGIDNQIRLLEIPSDLSYAYLKGHLLGRAEDWYKIFGSTLEPQVQDYVEVRNPQNTVQLLEVLSKFEERYSCKTMRDSGNSDNAERRRWNARRMSNADDSRRNSEIVRRPSNGRNDYRDNYENGRQGNQCFDSRNRFPKDDRRFNDRGYQFTNEGQNDDFSRGDPSNRGSSENFSQGDRRQRGRLKFLKVNEDQNNQSQSANDVPIKLFCDMHVSSGTLKCS